MGKRCACPAAFGMDCAPRAVAWQHTCAWLWFGTRRTCHCGRVSEGAGCWHGYRAERAQSGSAIPRAGHENYQLANLFDLPAGLTGRFEWIFEHTCFCAIEPRQRPLYVRGIISALVPKGFLLAIFYLNSWDPGEAPAEGGPPFGVTREELDGLFAASFDLVEELCPSAATRRTRNHPFAEKTRLIN
jgi:Thiopurine S-methyltransferase (TPMT)